jgi:hypothetical protein
MDFEDELYTALRNLIKFCPSPRDTSPNYSRAHDVAEQTIAKYENALEAAHERQQERLMEDGPGPSLQEQQIAAMRFK